MPRTLGILLHPTSLPSPYGIGTLGAEARSFVHWLADAGAGLWQVLPLVPTGPTGSPYSSWSALGGNPDLIDLDELVALRLLSADELPAAAFAAKLDFAAVRRTRAPLLQQAAARLLEQGGSLKREWRELCSRSPWVLETALFAAIKEAHGGAPWWQWPAPLAQRQPRALAKAASELRARIDNAAVLQFLFERQWHALRAYANEHKVVVLGDLPIYVDLDSVDVWSQRELFELDAQGRPLRVAGVPPDAFTELGQLWGNPLYLWPRLAEDDYGFWTRRLHRAIELFDWVRIDHFRGLASYWAVPCGASDARGGRWEPGPGLALFEAIERALGPLPIVAEDLGIIDDGVRKLLADTGFAGMRVLQFAFGVGDDNPYLPHNHVENCVVYTGTHDNETTYGWWQTLPEYVRHHVRVYFSTDASDIVWTLIDAACGSVARFAVVPAQDVLTLGNDARMNTPSVANGNWAWRLSPGDLRPEHAARVRQLSERHHRLP